MLQSINRCMLKAHDFIVERKLIKALRIFLKSPPIPMFPFNLVPKIKEVLLLVIFLCH